jgi:hypothetical protein
MRKLLQKPNTKLKQQVFFFSSCIGIFIGDSRLMDERWKIFGTFTTMHNYNWPLLQWHLDEGGWWMVLQVAAGRITMWWVNVCIGSMFLNNLIKTKYSLKFILVGWKIYCHVLKQVCVKSLWIKMFEES